MRGERGLRDALVVMRLVVVQVEGMEATGLLPWLVHRAAVRMGATLALHLQRCAQLHKVVALALALLVARLSLGRGRGAVAARGTRCAAARFPAAANHRMAVAMARARSLRRERRRSGALRIRMQALRMAGLRSGVVGTSDVQRRVCQPR